MTTEALQVAQVQQRMYYLSKAAHESLLWHRIDEEQEQEQEQRQKEKESEHLCHHLMSSLVDLLTESDAVISPTLQTRYCLRCQALLASPHSVEAVRLRPSANRRRMKQRARRQRRRDRQSQAERVQSDNGKRKPKGERKRKRKRKRRDSVDVDSLNKKRQRRVGGNALMVRCSSCEFSSPVLTSSSTFAVVDDVAQKPKEASVQVRTTQAAPTTTKKKTNNANERKRRPNKPKKRQSLKAMLRNRGGSSSSDSARRRKKKGKQKSQGFVGALVGMQL
jgi:hypothetical protein